VSDITGNIAQNNVEAGFVVEAATSRLAHANVPGAMAAMAFRSSCPEIVSERCRATSRSTIWAMDCTLLDGFGQGSRKPTATITGNTAFGSGAGDLADDTDCRFAPWVANRFGTAAQPCIH
jgi:hypothetical protein